MASQDIRLGKALLNDLEISYIKEETNSNVDIASVVTRNKSNFLGSAASPQGVGDQLQ